MRSWNLLGQFGWGMSSYVNYAITFHRTRVNLLYLFQLTGVMCDNRKINVVVPQQSYCMFSVHCLFPFPACLSLCSECNNADTCITCTFEATFKDTSTKPNACKGDCQFSITNFNNGCYIEMYLHWMK